MRSSDLFAKCLETEGVKYIFGIPGEETLELVDSIISSGIKFITTRHEQGAAFMADAYGRLTGRAGVCLSTLGPGATNLLTGIADANLDRAPLVAITAQTSLSKLHKESHQFVDIVQCFKPLTKWNTRVEDSSTIPEIVRKAFKIAESEKPGACHIEMPENIASEDIEYSPIAGSIKPAMPAPEQRSVDIAVDIINRAKNPVVIAGNGVIRGRASEEVFRFANKTNIPVANTFMGKGVVPSDSPLSLNTIGLQLKDYVSCGIDRADLIIAVGYDFAEYAPAFWNQAGDKKIVHIDFTNAEVDFHYQASCEVIGDIKTSLKLLSEKVKGRKDNKYTSTLRDYIIREMESGSNDNSFPMRPQRILSDIRKVLDKEDILISDVGAHKIWIARMFPTYCPNTVIISNGFASMGFALPAAITAKMVYPDRKVLAVCGDGGFLMNCQELETAVRLKLPFVSLIFNDNGYGLIRWKQVKRFGKSNGSVAFGNPDFVKFAESFGAKGMRIESASELEPALKEAFKSNVPVVIDVPVDYSENMKLTERMGRLICPI